MVHGPGLADASNHTNAVRPVIEPIDVPHPALPPGLEGLRVLHLADTHTRRRNPWTPAVQRLLDELEALKESVDLAVLTGDFADAPSDQAAGSEVTKALIERTVTRLGVFGVFGNHDGPTLRRDLRTVPGCRWLEAGDARLFVGPTPLRIIGVSDPEDMLDAALRVDAANGTDFTIGLSHYPTQVYPAARLGVHLMFCGHTHGGQIRVGPTRVPHSSSDLAGDVGTGCLRLAGTLCCISRGIGEAVVPIRVNCPPQVPLYTLRRGPFEGGDPPAPVLRQVIPW